jgi:hypothetical protein
MTILSAAYLYKERDTQNSSSSLLMAAAVVVVVVDGVE